jgi:hypothetical protein
LDVSRLFNLMLQRKGSTILPPDWCEQYD